MNYEFDPLNAIARLLARLATEIAKTRTRIGASHEALDSTMKMSFERQEHALAGATEMAIDADRREHIESRGLQEQRSTQILDRLQGIKSDLVEIKEFISAQQQLSKPIPQMIYGPPGGYPPLPGEGLMDPEDPQEVEQELRNRYGLSEEW
jgi:hypothetical protein